MVAALVSWSSPAQSRFVTLTVDGITQTNQQFTIQNNETAKLKWAFDSSGSFSLNVSRAGSSLSVGENQLQGNTMDSYHRETRFHIGATRGQNIPRNRPHGKGKARYTVFPHSAVTYVTPAADTLADLGGSTQPASSTASA